MIEYMRYICLAVVAGFLLDLCIGDPPWLYHPVRLIGHLITALEKLLRRIFPRTDSGERAAGVCLVIFVVLIGGGVPALLLYAAYRAWFWLGFALEVLFCGQILATKSLRDESMLVYEQLVRGDLPAARHAVSMIVGRDTDRLTEEGVAKAAIETVAENTSDGVVAPLFYLMLGGAVLGFVYKAVNTMDSMVGYKNERYRHFGTAAARLDDVLGYVPSRLSAWLMILASGCLHMDARNAARIYNRDKANHDSPNSAHTEAAMAGALRVQLAGDAWYFGELHRKKTIGDALRPVVYTDIDAANRLMTLTAALALLFFGLVRTVLVTALFLLW